MSTYILIYLAGLLTLPAYGVIYFVLCDIVDWWHDRKNSPPLGAWVIHSWSTSQTYDNGGMFSIYRYGHGHEERAIWDPPMRTREEALAECDRRNRAEN